MREPVKAKRDITPDSEKRQSPFDLELIISWLLRTGVLLSAGLILSGLLLLLVKRHSEYPVDVHSVTPLIKYHSETTAWFPTSIGSVFSGVAKAEPFALIMLGLLLLILTPMLRVAVSVVTFLLEKDRAFVWITLFVLGVLLASLFLGKATV